MSNILTAQQAFSALQAGKTILCRHILGEFESLDQFPATVFGLPDHEFCIQLEMIELAGIRFAKPLSMDEIQDGQDIFVMQSHGVVYHQKFNREVDGMIESVMGGFAQRDSENAKLQYNAFCKAVGFPTCDIAVIEVGLPKKRSNKSKSAKPIEVDQQINQATSDDSSIDDIIGPVSAQSSTSNDVEKKTSSALVTDDVLINHLLAVSTTEQLDKLEVSFEKHKSKMSDDKVQTYGRILEQKRKELATASEKPTTNFDAIASAAVNHAQKLDDDTADKNSKNREWTRFHNDKPYLDVGDKSQYEIEYADLMAVVIHAESPEEANSVVEKTHHWTIEQRAPLLSEISKRLCQIQDSNEVELKEPPSLMVQIQNAPDLTTLDALEIDVSTRHPDIQPRLMAYVKKRRFELEQATAANDEVST
ncbi:MULTISPECIES: hypothetical protein [unclassified Acinetobacter]|uniref:hypothetical protein n=1 Tax=unclassified Acinetobacter TaxID=196816 RepID=UPI00244B1065|nr:MULTISPECIES: hypothetical protein [unclassified Acinetobacter]MDH0032049.1 hypothetical protein [Acinetobacter sp. GD04021]MDH0887705.1 hypothetical protein [Acinetobacter sp. GD03873]MDH1084053.1 hypothetical protein [Acinetobacter sp. GD03983]MDH2191020.1 hypothetical protein [Acinetobacter sp. GD03645]MDH2204565.1 hypothetical protein [Acinetobacter sp. GD03647]